MRRALLIAALLAAAAGLSGCGTPYATVRTPGGEELMLLGHDPVAYLAPALEGREVAARPHARRV
jgi:hypothetical protein